MFRSGLKVQADAFEAHSWENMQLDAWTWQNTPSGFDIVAYRRESPRS